MYPPISPPRPFTPPPRTLYGLLATLFLVTAPHLPTLPPTITILSLTISAWWLLTVWKTGQTPKPSQLIRGGLALLIIAFIIIQHGKLMGRTAGVVFLVALTHVKLLEILNRRDYLVVTLLCCFLVMTHFFTSQSIPMALYALTTILAILITLNLPFHPNAPPTALLKRAGTLLLHALPVALVLFVLFPRLQNPLWSLPQGTTARQGLGNDMTPGSISRLINSGGIAFRARFDWNPPKLEEMYWRGPVLWQLRGDTWEDVEFGRHAFPVRYRGIGKPTSYAVTLEPHGRHWIFALDLPDSPPDHSRMEPDFQLLSRKPVNRTQHYQISSHLTYRASLQLPQHHQSLALQLPASGNPRSRQLARKWAEEAIEDREVVQSALTMFRNEPFTYTLSPPLLYDDPIDGFLFESRRGFCEHFAGAFTFLMRAANIPARVVTGYQGGVWSNLGTHLTVRQADAHAWSEVWLPETGWTRVDPTAAVAPERVERGLEAAIPAGEPLPMLIDPNNRILRRIWHAWDNVDNAWNQWVLGYDARRQFAFLNTLGWEGANYRELALGLVAGMALLFALLAGHLLWSERGKRKDPVQRLYHRFCAQLARHGVPPRATTEGPLDFAERAARAKPQAREPIHEATRLYIALRYRPNPPPEGLTLLKRWVRKTAVALS